MKPVLFIAMASAAVLAQSVTVLSRDTSPPPLSAVGRERSPEQVASLPEAVRGDLAGRRCRVPLYRGSTRARDEALASGHFHTAAAVDWAVVCHVPERKAQDVYVYSLGADGWKAERIEKGVFGPFPQAGGCEETVDAADAKEIRELAKAFAPGELRHLPPLDHQGVEVGMCEKSSVIYFYSAGRWVGLQGGD